MHDKPKESDWKAFSKLVPDARERYLEKVNEALASHLQTAVGTPTERFWDVEAKIKKEAKILRNCLDDHRRSTMHISLLMMLRHKMLTDQDLEVFSEELRDRLIVLRDL